MQKRSIAALTLMVLTACGGGGSSSTAPLAPAARPTASSAVVPVAFRIVIPKATSSKFRHAAYISPSTASASIQVNGGTATTGTCTSVCSLTVDAPIGSDTFAITLLDINSAVLSQASTTQMISPTIANVVNVAFGGAVAKIALSAVTNSFNTGSSVSTAVNIVTRDADNNVIIGSDPYLNPVTITNTDASGYTSVSTTSITSPATSSVTFSYTGNVALGNSTVTLSATASGVTPANIISAPISLHYASGTVLEYSVPTAGAYPEGIVAGPDGNVWFTEQNGNNIGRVTLTGTVTEFAVPTSGAIPAEIIAGAGSYLWFSENSSGNLGKITTTGSITEYSSGFTGGNGMSGLILANDGNVYVCEFQHHRIAKFDTSTLTATEFANISGGVQPEGIVQANDGRLYFTQPFPVGNDTLGISTLAGVLSGYPLPANTQGRVIVNGPDGNMWFTDSNNNVIVRETTSGGVLQYAIPTGGASPNGIVSAPDGNLWFTEISKNKIASITTGGTITEHALPTANSQPYDITVGPDGNLWFSEPGTNKIGRYIL